MRTPVLTPSAWLAFDVWHSLTDAQRSTGLAVGDSIPQHDGTAVLIEALDPQGLRIRARGESGRLRWFKPHEVQCNYSVPSPATFLIGGRR